VVSFTSRPLYPQGKSPWYPLDRFLIYVCILFETFFNMVKVFTAWYVVKLRENFSITFTKI
jgi:hypothetical protein